VLKNYFDVIGKLSFKIQEELNELSAATGEVVNPRQALRELEKALPKVFFALPLKFDDLILILR